MQCFKICQMLVFWSSILSHIDNCFWHEINQVVSAAFKMGSLYTDIHKPVQSTIDRRETERLSTTMSPTVEYHNQIGHSQAWLSSVSILYSFYVKWHWSVFLSWLRDHTSITQHNLETQSDWDLTTRRDIPDPVSLQYPDTQTDIFKCYHFSCLRYFPSKDIIFFLGHKYFFSLGMLRIPPFMDYS